MKMTSYYVPYDDFTYYESHSRKRMIRKTRVTLTEYIMLNSIRAYSTVPGTLTAPINGPRTKQR
eukprot:scaffold326024_cov61-Attheya_sp.AAC.2